MYIYTIYIEKVLYKFLQRVYYMFSCNARCSLMKKNSFSLFFSLYVINFQKYFICNFCTVIFIIMRKAYLYTQIAAHVISTFFVTFYNKVK